MRWVARAELSNLPTGDEPEALIDLMSDDVKTGFQYVHDGDDWPVALY